MNGGTGARHRHLLAGSRTCTIADSTPSTLQFVFDDYIHHMLEHLRHMGVKVDDFAAQPGNIR